MWALILWPVSLSPSAAAFQQAVNIFVWPATYMPVKSSGIFCVVMGFAVVLLAVSRVFRFTTCVYSCTDP